VERARPQAEEDQGIEGQAAARAEVVREHDFDVVVAGAGPAGLVLARDLAHSGFSVALCDPRTPEQLGGGVVVELENGTCEALGIEPPRAEEIPYHPQAMRILTADGRFAFEVRGGIPATAIYLDRFTRRLLERAVDAGVDFRPGWRAECPLVAGERVTGVRVSGPEGESTLRSRLLVDATGFAASLLRRLELPGVAVHDDPRDVVRAGTRLSRIDPDEARRAVREGRQADQEVWSWLGRLGNYSTEFRHLSLEDGLGYMLVGYKAELASELLGQALRAGLDGVGAIGEPIHGRDAPIRIGHTRHQLAWSGFAVVGEAARMVVPPTGSGVASSMLAASLLARIARGALKTGEATSASLHPWANHWHRGRGAVQAGLDAIRIAYDGLTERRCIDFMGGGFTGPEDLIASATCALPPLTSRTLIRRARAIRRNPRLVPPLVQMGSIMGAIVAHHRRYPKRWDPQEVEAWGRRSDRLFGRLRGERERG
jgi:flavin-dependent dehydrogenase